MSFSEFLSSSDSVASFGSSVTCDSCRASSGSAISILGCSTASPGEEERLLMWSWCLLTSLPSCSMTTHEQGPVTSDTLPDNHTGPFAKFLTKTWSPRLNCRSRAWRSCPFFWRCWLDSTHASLEGLLRSKRVVSLLPNINSDGDAPVVECGVFLYAKRNRATRSESVPSLIFFSPSLKILTTRSANPFVAGW